MKAVCELTCSKGTRGRIILVAEQDSHLTLHEFRSSPSFLPGKFPGRQRHYIEAFFFLDNSPPIARREQDGFVSKKTSLMPAWKRESIMSSLRPKGFFPTPGSPRSQRAWPRRWGAICSMSSRTSGSTASMVRSYLEMAAAMVPSLAKILPGQDLRVYSFFALQADCHNSLGSDLDWHLATSRTVWTPLHLCEKPKDWNVVSWRLH